VIYFSIPISGDGDYFVTINEGEVEVSEGERKGFVEWLVNDQQERYDNPAYGDPDRWAGEELVKETGGKIINYIAPDLIPGVTY